MNYKKALAPVALAFALVSAPTISDAHDADEFADLVEKVTPATVSIAVLKNVSADTGTNGGGAAKIVPDNNPFPFLDGFNNDLDKPQYTPAGAIGSGFVIDKTACHVVTNNHVINGGDKFAVTFPNGEERLADLVGQDAMTDLAVLKTDCDTPLQAEVGWADSDKARIGHDVFAIGNPLGISNTVTKGIISQLNRDLRNGPYDNFIQTDASINSGNSGGALFDLNGDVVGVNSAIISKTGGSVGLGFSIASNLANHVTAQLIKYGEAKRGWLGVEIQGLNEAVAKHLGLSDISGALVSAVKPGGPAEGAGLKQADVILEFDGQKVESSNDLPRIVAFAEIGRDVDVKVWRDGAAVTLKVKIGDLANAVDETAPASEDQPDLPPEAQEVPVPKLEQPEIPPGFKIPLVPGMPQ